MVKENIHILLNVNDLGKRIDIILSERIKNLSRNRIQNLIIKNFVKIDGKIINDRSFLVKSIGKVEITIPEVKSSSIFPQKINLNIVFLRMKIYWC